MILNHDDLQLKDMSAVQCTIAEMFPGSEDAVEEMINYVLRRKNGVSHQTAMKQLRYSLKEHEKSFQSSHCRKAMTGGSHTLN